MRLEAAELVRVTIPLVGAFTAAFGTLAARDVLLVRLVTDVGEGWGECTTLAEPFYNEEFFDASAIVLRRWLLPPLFQRSELRADEVRSVASRVKGFAAAKAAVEMALLDAELRHEGRSLSSYLGGTRSRVDVGVVVGILGSVHELCETVARFVAEGYARVKLKIEPGWDHQPASAVREAFDTLPLQVDANAAYDPSSADRLLALDGLNLLMIEQPFAADDIDAHRRLATRMATPICLDESIPSLNAAVTALDTGACSIVNLKVGRVGGVIEARRIHDLCRARGVPVWCGGMAETGVGRAANVALASLPGFTLPGDISASSRYFARDVTAPFELVGSSLAVPGGPGLGVSVDDDFLTELGATREVVRGAR